MKKNRFRLASVRVVPVRWRLRRPFVTSLGRKTHSDNVLVAARLTGGAAGWGEASSSLAMPFQTGPRMAAALRRLGRRFAGADVRDIGPLAAAVWRAEGRWPTAAAAFETALWDALARACGIPFSHLFGGARRELSTLVTLSVDDPARTESAARAAARAGFPALKLKLDGRDPLRRDRERLRAARRGAPRARLLADANQSYRPAALEALLDGARRDGVAVELVEEPFRKRDWRALRAFRGGAPLLLDETVQTPADARRAVAGRYARGVNVKLAKSGLARGKRIVDEFRRRKDALLMIGCMAESKIGLAAGVHWACGLGAFDYADLDSDLLLKPTGGTAGYRRKGPVVSLPKRLPAGLGVSWP